MRKVTKMRNNYEYKFSAGRMEVSRGEMNLEIQAGNSIHSITGWEFLKVAFWFCCCCCCCF